MNQFKEDINKILKNNDTERTLLLRFFDGYLYRLSKQETKTTSNNKEYIYLLSGIAIGYFLSPIIDGLL